MSSLSLLQFADVRLHVVHATITTVAFFKVYRHPSGNWQMPMMLRHMMHM